MRCPVCEMRLVSMNRQGVDIDICPQCRGVWLDRGELDLLIELSTPKSPLSNLFSKPFVRQERFEEERKPALISID